MARRPQLDDEFQRWLKKVGAHIADLRAERGWTQVRAAEHCGIDAKQYQDIERGRRPVTARTLFVLARGFGVDPAELVPHSGADRSLAGTTGLVAALEQSGWQQVDSPGEQSIPVYDLRLAAGRVGAPHVPAAVAYVQPPEGRRLDTEGLFVAQVHGTSMEPRVGDGAWCLFRQPVVPPLVGKVVLVRSAPEGDEAAAYQLKRVGAIEAEDDGTLRIRLDSANRAFPPRTVLVAAETDLMAIGELVEVLTPRGAS